MMILGPERTEKAIKKIEDENTLTFNVMVNATKKDIRDEVEKLFNVKVATIKTYVTPRGKKHALVKLKKEFKADDVATKLKLVA